MGGEDNATPPAELIEFQQLNSISTVWSTQLGSGTDKLYLKLVPTVDGERVFAADRDGDVYAVSLTTGKQHWTTELDLPISGGPGAGEGLVVVGTTDGEVVALDEANGQILWKVPAPSEILAAPQIADGIVVVRTADGKITGYSAKEGKRIWFYNRSTPTLTLRGTSAPVIRNGLVIAGFDNGRLAALDLKTGRLQWDARISIASGRSELDRMVDIDAEPVIYDDTIYVATYQGNLSALSSDDGRMRWSRDISSYAGVGLNDAAIFISDSGDQVWSLDRLTGTSIWRQEQLARRQLTAPASIGDLVVVGDLEGYLHWMRAEDGLMAARVQVDDSPIIAPVTVVDDLMLCYSASGKLTALRISQ